MRFSGILEKVTQQFLKIILWVSVFFLASSVLFYVLNCLLRYAFKSPLAWPEEYCTYIVVFMVFLMQCRLEFRDESLSISVIWDKAAKKPVVRKWFLILKEIVIIGIACVMAKVGFSQVQQQFQYGTVTPVMRIPFALYYAAICICFILIIVTGIIHLLIGMQGQEEEVNRDD